MSEVTLYHNPRCSKSRQTLALLEARDLTIDIVLYLETPPDPVTLKRLLEQLGMAPRELMRKKEAPYAELNLGDADKDQATLIQAMSDHPILIERPIVVANGKAALGRPPENVLEIL